jgi:hypothetical protein
MLAALVVVLRPVEFLPTTTLREPVHLDSMSLLWTIGHVECFGGS